MSKVATVFDRAREFEKEGFDSKDSILMCKFCNVRIEWKRRDTCVKHCKESGKHIKNKKDGQIKRQSSLVEAVNNANVSQKLYI